MGLENIPIPHACPLTLLSSADAGESTPAPALGAAADAAAIVPISLPFDSAMIANRAPRLGIGGGSRLSPCHSFRRAYSGY